MPLFRPTLHLAALLVAGSLGAQESAAPDADAGPAPAATETPAAAPELVNGAQVGDWTVVCEAIAVNRTNCALTQVRVRTEGGALLAGVVVAPAGEAGADTVLTVRVPAGAWLAAGVALRADSEGSQPVELDWQVCGAELCEAAVQLDTAALDTLTAAGVAILGYSPTPGAEPLLLTIPMNGLSEGLSGLRG